MARIALMILGLAVAASTPAVGLVDAGWNKDGSELVVKREEELGWALASDDDDDDGDTSDFTSGVDSNDRTGSGHSAVSRDRDRSRGDRTRDRTRDGAGGPKRDWTGNHTNDRSRNDSR